MSTMFLACESCGVPIPVEQEMVLNAIALNGRPPNVAHEVCPGQEPAPTGEVVAPVMRRFAINVTVAEVWPDSDEAYEALEIDPTQVAKHVRWRDPDLGGISLDVLTRAQTVVESTNFPTAMHGPLSDWLETTWRKATENSFLADLTVTPPA